MNLGLPYVLRNRQVSVPEGLVVACLLASVACGGSGPRLQPIDERVARVGEELQLEIFATDPDGDAIDYGFAAQGPSSAAPVEERASLAQTARGGAVFRFVPNATDVGEWYIDFTANDGDGSDTLTVRIDVRSAVGGAATPIFRRPLGSGATLDLEVDDCLDVTVVVEDQDSAEVTLGVNEPLDGANFDQTEPLAGVWSWCPTAAQISGDDRYEVIFTADDGTNPVSQKPYLVVLKKPTRPDCPGLPPTISHTPMDASTVADLTISATISDDLGLKGPPLLYYSLAPGGSLSQMTQATMTGVGTQWQGVIPNPVAQMPGASRTVYYIVSADDDDDPVGDCDHNTLAPSSGTFQMTITNPGTGGTLTTCEPCSADSQCLATHLCMNIPADQGASCLEICDDQSDCAADETCSASAVSENGAVARVCAPDTGTCESTTSCLDDSLEENDSRVQASTNPAVTGTINGTVCVVDGVDDEDWYKVTATAEGQLRAALTGDGITDLDLDLYDAGGTRIATSTTQSSDETVAGCYPAGTYYVRVYAFGVEPSNYSLTITKTAQACSLSCTDDLAEDDDTTSTARPVGLTYNNASNMICPGDRDLFSVFLFTGETITANLMFTQANSQQDLDVHLLNVGGTDLTPCSPAEPTSCDADNGQSSNSNETFVFTAPAACSPCRYYLSVEGYGGAVQNSYGITIAIE